MKKALICCAAAGLLVFSAGFIVGGGHILNDANAQQQTKAARLVFNEKGEAAVPKGYRSWVHVSTAWEPITISILDLETTETSEFNSVYVEPSAYRTYMETGQWPDGTLIVKEFSSTQANKEECKAAPAYTCDRWYGPGIFQSSTIGVGVMLKDKKRFPDAAGHWAYFSYGHQEPPYQQYAAAHETERCAQCHIDRVGPANDYVFSVFKIGLRRDGDAARHNIAASLPD